ncbi:MAG TPA: potassium channel family protein [Pseudonocardia sp.]|nr:potassium channel family protein [Pseudonocardia sp.]
MGSGERAGGPRPGDGAGPWYRRHGPAVAALARSTVSAVLLVVVYYRAPLDRPLDPRVALWLVLGLIAFAASIAYQVRAIVRSPIPHVRAVETVEISLPFLLLLYASAYSLMSYDEPASFTEVLDRTDALYFTVTVFATVGFGDIAPVTRTARVVTMTQMLVGLLTVGVVARLLLGAVQRSVDRRAAREPIPPVPSPSTAGEPDRG